MARPTRYRYLVVFLRDDGTELDRVPIVPDWGAALEWLYFAGARRGQVPPLQVCGAALAGAEVKPNWHARAGKPYVQSLRATLPIQLPSNGSPQPSSAATLEAQIPTAYLKPAAQRAATQLVERGLLAPQQAFRYLVAAFETAESVTVALAPGSFAVEEMVEPLPFEPAPLAEFLGAADAATAGDEDDFPIFLPRSIIAEGIALGQAAGDHETGGFLLGYLHRDPQSCEIFVAVTEQLPARFTEADSSKITFTPATWEAVHAAIQLGGRDTMLLGWWHVHQDLCRLRGCPLERRRECALSRPFFSEDDVLLQATCFSRPYHLGLLISDHSGDGWSATVFGWRHGMVVQRGYHSSQSVQTPPSKRGGAAGESYASVEN